MFRVDVRPGQRARDRRVAPLLALSLAVGVTVAATLAPSLAPVSPLIGVARAAANEPTEGTGDPTATGPTPTEAPPTVDPPATTTPPPPVATTTAPPPEPIVTTAAPTTTAPTTTFPTTAPPLPGTPPKFDPPPARPAPDQAPPAHLGVRVTTSDLTLTSGYWNAASTEAALQVTVTNTGVVAEEIRLAYSLPAGLTDAGTRGCASAGGQGYRCGAWTSAPGARFSTVVRVRVSGNAWQQMPLSGAVEVTASAPGRAGSVTDHQGFAVLFPPGPPAPGIALEAGGVDFDISGGLSTLDVRLGNTGRVDAAALVEVILPQGVSVPTRPAGCVAAAPGRTRCDLGTLPAGRSATFRLPVAATPEAQREAPLAGAVAGQLDPRTGKTRRVQMSFRITAAAAVSAAAVNGPVPTGSQGVLSGAARVSGADGRLAAAQRTAVLLIVVSGLLVVLALALATTSLRRRTAVPAAEQVATPGTE